MSTKDTTIPSEVPILDGSNYRTWERMMKLFLQTKGLYRLIRATYHIPSGLSEAQRVEYDAESTSAERIKTLQDILLARETWEEENNKILGYINLKVLASIQQITASHATARDLWDHLATTYGTTRSAGIFNDFREVTDWKFDDKKNPTDSINKLLARIEWITSKGVRLPSNIAAMILLKAVPRHWDNFASMILL